MSLWGFIRERQLPPPHGPHPVGRTTFDWTDFGGPEVVGWYPAEKPAKDSVADYMPGLFAEDMLRGHGPFSQRLGVVKDRAYSGGTLRTIRPPLPTVYLSPDWDEQPTDYAVLAEELASRGYVVVGTSPRDSAGPTGRGARIAARAAEIRSFSERIDRLSKAGVGLWARLNTGAVALIGHGIGGAASVRACAEDARCAAVVDLDGEPGAGVALAKPVLFIVGRGATLPGDAAAFPRATGVRIRGLPGRNFTDDAVFFQPLGRLRQLFGQLDGRRGLQIVGDYTGAFLDEHLRGRPTPWLHRPAGPYDEARVELGRR